MQCARTDYRSKQGSASKICTSLFIGLLCILSSVAPCQVRYVRPAGKADIPERPKAADIQAILDSLEQRKQNEENNLKQAAVPFAQAFRAFEQQYSGIRRTGPVQDIIVLRAKLGNDFVPKDASDIEAIQMVFARCLRTDAIQSPAEESPAYRDPFPEEMLGPLNSTQRIT